MKVLVVFPLLLSSILFAQSQETGKDVFNKNCAKCHAKVLGITNNDGYENTYITVAPYVSKVVEKLKEKTDSKAEFAKFIKEYIENPDKRKSLYGKRAIKEYGLMPALEKDLTNIQITKLTDFLYNYEENTQVQKKKKKYIVKEMSKGEKLFNDNCAVCHAKVLGITNNDGYENTYITSAPYVSKVVQKLKVKTASKEEFTQYIEEYIKNPDKSKSLYGKKAIKEYGLMPPFKGILNNKDIKELSNYLYNYND